MDAEIMHFCINPLSGDSMTEKKFLTVHSNDDFNLLLTSIDDELKNEEYQIFQRPMEACLRIHERYDLILGSMFVKTRDFDESVFRDSLSTEINYWYRNRYGEKLKFDPTWKLAVLIRGDVFRVRLPLVFGMPILNLFDLIDDLTESFSKELDKIEVEHIQKLFQIAQKNRNELTTLIELPLISEIKGDLDAAVSHLFTTPPQMGLSKWASLQVTEKVIKSYISQKGSTFQFTHNLQNLVNQAEALGLPQIPKTLIDLIQCPAGVRYGNPIVSLEDAVNAHHASINISLRVSIHLGVLQRAKCGVELIPDKYYVDTFERVARCISVENDVARIWYIEPNQCFEHFLPRERWAEYIGLDIPSIINPIEETYRLIVQQLNQN